MNKSNAEILIEAIMEESQNLNDWESDFVNSIAEQLETRNYLSEKQSDKLQDIYDKLN